MMDKGTEKVLKISGVVFGSLTVFSYLLYFVGRTYCQFYFAALNVPVSVLNYGFADYAFIGARPDNLLIVLLFTSLVIGLLLYLFFPQFTDSQEQVSKRDIGFGVGYIVCFAFSMVIAFVLLLTSQGNKFQVGILFLFPLASVGFFWLIFSEKTVLSYIRNRNGLCKTFFATALVILVLFPYTCSTGWGAFRGVGELDKNPFGYQLVELHSKDRLIDDIEWENTADDTYKTSKQLELIHVDGKYAVVREIDKASIIYIIKSEDILSIKVVAPKMILSHQ